MDPVFDLNRTKFGYIPGGYIGALKCLFGFHENFVQMNGLLKTREKCRRCGKADGPFEDGFDRMKKEVRKRHKRR